MNTTQQIAEALAAHPESAVHVHAAILELRRLAKQPSEGMLMLAARAPAEPPMEVWADWMVQWGKANPRPPDGDPHTKDWRRSGARAWDDYKVLHWPAIYAQMIAKELAK